MSKAEPVGPVAVAIRDRDEYKTKFNQKFNSKVAKSWEEYSAEEHFMFYKLISLDFAVALLYSNGEKVLFLPP